MNKKYVVVYGDGIHDDTAALQEIANGNAKGITPNGATIERANIECLITEAIKMPSNIKKPNKSLNSDPQ